MKTISIICGLVSAILTLIAASKWKEINLIGKIALVFSIVTLFIGAIVSYQQKRKDDIKEKKEELKEKVNATYGSISDHEENPDNKKNTDDDEAKMPIFAIGFQKDAPRIKQVKNGIFMHDGKELLKVYIKNNKLLVSAVIKDRMGEPILAILDNEWTLYDNAYEFNNDDNALELVTKGERDVFFHLKLLQGIVYLEGTLYISNEYGINIFEGPKWNGIQILGPDVYPDNSSLKRVFKYPRQRYLGVREVD